MRDFDKRLNQFVKDENGELWKVISYCAEPTVTLEKVGLGIGKPEMHVAVGSRIADNFTPIGEKESEIVHTYHEQVFRRNR